MDEFETAQQFESMPAEIEGPGISALELFESDRTSRIEDSNDQQSSSAMAATAEDWSLNFVGVARELAHPSQWLFEGSESESPQWMPPIPQDGKDLNERGPDAAAMEESDVVAPQMEAPEVAAPQMEASEVAVPQMEAPEVVAPQMEASEVVAPQMEAAEVVAPQMEAAEVMAPHVSHSAFADLVATVLREALGIEPVQPPGAFSQPAIDSPREATGWTEMVQSFAQLKQRTVQLEAQDSFAAAGPVRPTPGPPVISTVAGTPAGGMHHRTEQAVVYRPAMEANTTSVKPHHMPVEVPARHLLTGGDGGRDQTHRLETTHEPRALLNRLRATIDAWKPATPSHRSVDAPGREAHGLPSLQPSQTFMKTSERHSAFEIPLSAPLRSDRPQIASLPLARAMRRAEQLGPLSMRKSHAPIESSVPRGLVGATDAGNKADVHEPRIFRTPLRKMPQVRHLIGAEIALCILLSAAAIAREQQGNESATTAKPSADGSLQRCSNVLPARPVHKICVGETLEAIAMQHFGDPDVAWVIAQLNECRTTQTDEEGNLIVRVVEGTALDLPISTDLRAFYEDKTHRCRTSKCQVMTVISENALRRQAIRSLAPAMGVASL